MEQAERAFLRRLLTTLAVVLLALLAWKLRVVLLLAFVATLVATILATLASALSRWVRIPPKAALPAAVITLIGIVGGSAWLFGAEAADRFRALTDTLPEAWRGLQQRLDGTALSGEVAEGLDDLTPSTVLSGAGNFAMTLGSGIAGALLALIGGIYFAADPGFYRAGLLKLFPQSKRELIGAALTNSGRALRLWLLGQLVSMLAIGVLTGVGLVLIGVPSAIALGLLAGLAEFVPLVGPIVAAVPALLIALNEGNDVALLTLALYVGLQQFEGYVLTPLVQQKVAALPAAVTLFAIVAAGVLLGILGVLLAAPLTVVLYVLIKQLYVREALDTPTTIPGEPKAGQYG